MRTYKGIEIPIPNILNLGILGAGSVSAISLLVLASRAESWWSLLGYALGFSFVGNTLFSLLHDAVHRSANSNPSVNDWIGRICAGFFPTGFVFQRACHLGHHRRNRTDHEMFDLYYENDNRFLKYLQIYTILLGFYWTAAPIGSLIYLIFPGLLNLKILRNRASADITHMGADAMISSILRAPPLEARLEILFTILFQATLIWTFGISWVGWLTCYWAFAINWGSLQYADHAWSARDIRNGAWNLRTNRVVQAFFLNYHHHLAHHQHPSVPWIHLEKFVDYSKPRPTFWSIYMSLWKGPRLTTEPPPTYLDPELDRTLV